ncbi:MAG: glycoside hydrolase family 5 protein [Treponema sp.]|nr:glycoside hydrolase family 5 protein [Treponema sp.]
MKTWNGYMKGVNLGGWLSQCNYEKKHLKEFITETDIKKIKSWGMDHVRLPFDFNIIQDKAGNFSEEGFHYLDNAVTWCQNAGLNIVLDLHKAQGFSFDKDEMETGLFGNPVYEKLFIDLWIVMAARYGKIGPNVSFELLNEVTSPAFNEGWMRLAEKTIREIRRIAPDVQILLGGYWNNSPDAVKDLILPPDSKVYYNFHSYDPMCFTHQGAGWLAGMPVDFRLKYPFNFDDEEAQGAKPFYELSNMKWPSGKSDVNLFEEKFADAIRCAEERDTILYCGEYGVIDYADPESTCNWFKEINSVLNKYKIGHCMWNYKEKNFGLEGSHYDSVRDEILKSI